MASERLPSLPEDAFLALAAVAWADGRLDPDEADAIVRAAADEGISIEGLERIERSVKAYRERPPGDRLDGPLGAKHGPDLSFLDRSSMTKYDRVFLYGVACWISQVDRVVTPEESDTLQRLGERLGVPDRLRARAEELARKVASLPDGDRPDRYDLARLRETIGNGLGPAQGTTSLG
jgi:uncharacterized tellurite resistance protein B-like protein